MHKDNWITLASSDTRAWLAASENRTGVLAVVVGTGTGLPCSYCHKPIYPTAVEYEVQAYVLTMVRTLHFHRVCHHLWESARSGQEVNRNP